MTHVRDHTAWLLGGDSVCEQPPPIVYRTWRLVLLGAPGVGKGTQADLLAATLGACPLSTGDIFRAARTNPAQTGPAMTRAQENMNRGELVSDETVLAIIRERSRCLHCRGGFMLDGFPRTLAQARDIDTLLAAEKIQLDAVINYELPVPTIVSRISGRRICPACKAVYHLTSHPPKAENVCDQCGGPLQRRPDDRPEAAHVRLSAYQAVTVPLAAYYEAKGLLITINAEGAPKDILSLTMDALSSRGLGL